MLEPKSGIRPLAPTGASGSWVAKLNTDAARNPRDSELASLIAPIVCKAQYYMPCKLLFVCLGNICRSPSAENIMNHLVEQVGLSESIICDSAGTGGYHIGSPPDRRMAAAAQRRGIMLKGKARQFQKSDFETFDLILAMDRENYQDILSLDRAGTYQDKVRLMCDFATHHREQEVPDPYYGGTEGFNSVIDLLLDACEGLLQHVVKTYALTEKK